jgi:hypothetical protein
VTIEEYPEDEEADGSFEVAYCTMSKQEADDIQWLWQQVEKFRHSYSDKDPSEIALNRLKEKYHIITWSGVDLQVHEMELHGYKK